MDANEVVKGFVNRHPWELSRTACLIDELSNVIENNYAPGAPIRVLSIGTGDCYFEKRLLEKYKNMSVDAVDIAYSGVKPEGRLTQYGSLEALPKGVMYDMVIMLDSLEYMADSKAYVADMSSRMRKGACMFMCVPAFKKLWSRHDVIVKLLRRYDKAELEDILGASLKKCSMRYFFFSLYLVRLLQIRSGAVIDKDEKVTTGWKWGRKHPITAFVTGALAADFKLGGYIPVPGLSLLAVYKKA